MKKLVLAACLAAAATPSAYAEGLTDKSWDEIVAQAKTEGSVTWFNWFFEPEFREQVKAFEAEYGIEVNVPDVSSADDALNKVFAEEDQEAGSIDVLSAAGQVGNRIALSDIFAGPILPILPEAAALTSEVEGADWQGYGIQFWGNQTGMIYDSNRVSVDELPQTLADLDVWLDENPGQFGLNFENGGSGPSFIGNIARNILGVTDGDAPESLPEMTAVHDWFIDRDGDYILTASNADSLSRLTSGEFLMVPGWEDMLSSMQRRNEIGEHIKFYIPQWGMNGGGNAVAIPKNAPHPAAALLFVSWLTSAETQTRFNADFGSAPANANADDSKALVSKEERANTRSWTAPLKNDDIVTDLIENVFQR